MKQFKVINTETSEIKTITASTAQEAVEKSGWFSGWCQVRELTLFNGGNEMVENTIPPNRRDYAV
jgi:hypothetical protein